MERPPPPNKSILFSLMSFANKLKDDNINTENTVNKTPPKGKGKVKKSTIGKQQQQQQQRQA